MTERTDAVIAWMVTSSAALNALVEKLASVDAAASALTALDIGMVASTSMLPFAVDSLRLAVFEAMEMVKLMSSAPTPSKMSASRSLNALWLKLAMSPAATNLEVSMC